ncbi:response regulator [Sphingobacterium sp. lm-10]|uniref:response regulator n=1 Tax=Sphingobacterium sp. lm-10 TaxID=2944904 RepID=UPI002020B638|nr:response regulator [Sphingobacterium sp. lm-10]MCL7987606.1 response regulator [Sphingobacterium sp. lm-10]
MKKILVVDDNEGILDVLSIILEGEGYEVQQIIEPEKVLNLGSDLPDLILLDIWMSGADGRVICRHLKDQPKTKHVPVLLMSANKDIAEIAEEASADGYIAKPFEMEELIEMVGRFVNKSAG